MSQILWWRISLWVIPKAPFQKFIPKLIFKKDYLWIALVMYSTILIFRLLPPSKKKNSIYTISFHPTIQGLPQPVANIIFQDFQPGIF